MSALPLDFDLNSLQGLLGQMGPNAGDQEAARKAALMMAGFSLLGTRKGQEWGAVGAAGQNAMQQYQGQLAAGPKMRQENIKQVMELQKLMKDAQMQDMAMRLIGNPGSNASPPEQAGPPSPSGQQATYAPPQQPQGQGGGGMPYSASAEQGWAILNPKVADVLHRQNEISQGPQGTLMKNGQIVGQVLKTGMVVNGQFTALPPAAFASEAQQAGAVKGAETAAEYSAKQPYQTIQGPYGPGGAQTTQYMNNALGQPPVGGTQPDGITSIMPRNEQEAASLTRLLGDRGIGAQYVQQNGQFVAGPSHGRPLNQGGATGVPPLAMKQAEQNIATQGAQDTEIGKSFGQDYVGIVQAEKSAPGNIGKYELLKSHLSKVETGKLAPSVLSLKAIASYVAPNLAKDWTKDVPYAQASSALANELALQLRNPAGGAGMPGSLSDSDRNFLVSMTASAANDPRAIPIMLDARIALEKRNQEVGKLAREYRATNGKIDEGFYSALSQYSESHPLFAGMSAPAQAGPSGISPAAAAAELARRGVKF